MFIVLKKFTLVYDELHFNLNDCFIQIFIIDLYFFLYLWLKFEEMVWEGFIKINLVKHAYFAPLHKYKATEIQ